MNDLNNEDRTTGGKDLNSTWKNRDAITIIQEDVEMGTVTGPFMIAGYLLILVAMSVFAFVS